MWGSLRSKIRQRYSKQPAKQFTVQSFLDSLHLGSYGPVGDYDVLRDHLTGRGGSDLGDPFTEGLRWRCPVFQLVMQMLN